MADHYGMEVNRLVRFGLVCALPGELSALAGLLGGPSTGKPPPCLSPVEGEFKGARYAAVCSGPGKAAAGAATELVIERYGPGSVLNFGVAGALDPGLKVGDVVIADNLYQADFGVVYKGGFRHTGVAVMEEGEMLYVRGYEPGEELLRAAGTAAGRSSPLVSGSSILTGTVVSVDQFVTSADARRELGGPYRALAVDMEGAAAAHIASLNGVPFLALKAISDSFDFDAVGFDRMVRNLEENRLFCWWRRARFAAIHPGAFSRLSKMREGLRLAARNAAVMVRETMECASRG